MYIRGFRVEWGSMEAKRIVSAVVKLWVLAMVGGAIYFLWKDRAGPPLASILEAEENIAHTNVDVRIGTIQKMTLHGYVVGFGNVEPSPATADAPAADARITVDWPAVISEVRCIEGQHIDKGQTLFVARPANLQGGGGALAEQEIVAPISGTVVSLDIHPGEVALPTATAVEVVDLGRLVVAAQIPAWEASLVSIGQKASVEIPADPVGGKSSTFDSAVVRIDPGVDPKSNLVGVDVAVPPNQGARLGQLSRVRISNREQADCLVVPADAIVRDTIDRPFIGIVSDDRKQAILKPVVPGLREGDWVQITGDGIAADQTIVVGGAYALQYRSDINVLNP
jgi:membrane fusion protein, multidrug efflux system